MGFCFTFTMKFQNRNIPLLIGVRHNYSIITARCLKMSIENYSVIPTPAQWGQRDRHAMSVCEENHIWVVLNTD